MNEILNIRLVIALNLIIAAFVIMIAVIVVDEHRKEQIAMLDNVISERFETLKTLAELTNRNGGDVVVSKIISDCPSRKEFDSLLGDLSVLSKIDLIKTQQFFEACGPFFAERKLLMVFRMEREFESVAELIEIRGVISENSILKDTLSIWKELIEIEKKRADLLSEQVDIQDEIISLLIQGFRPESVEIKTQTARAQNVSELLAVHASVVESFHADLGI